MTESKQDLNGKTILITGATNGIGRVTAESLAKMGARLILVGRNREKTARVLHEIITASGNQQVETLLADLSLMEDVRRLAQEVKARCSRLDVLINNAGAIFPLRELTREGLEMTFALNHINYFLLTSELMDLLKSSGSVRIVNTSSIAHQISSLNFDNLQAERGYIDWIEYGRTKLMNLYFTYELARRLDGNNITVNAFHPGYVKTNFALNGTWVRKTAYRIGQWFAISPEAGAQTQIYLATSPEVEGISGKYFVREKAVRSSAASYDIEAAKRLWKISEEIVHQKFLSS